jgi:subtilisin family serine protease
LLAANIFGREYVPNEILIQYTDQATATQQSQARSDVSGRLLETTQTRMMKAAGFGKLERISLRNGVGIEQAIAALNQKSYIQYAEPNYIYHPTAISNDFYYTKGSLWGMYGDDSPAAVGPGGTTNPYGIQAEKAWNESVTGSANVVVGIIDEGIQINHPDLVNNIWVNPWEIANDGIDNDGNGYVDDINGWDFVNNDNTVYHAGLDSHGTHVAGTIGGQGSNGQGVAGVNWDVTMIPARFLGSNGGTTADAVKALDYLTDLKTRHGINLVATNNSWGGGGYSQALQDAIIRSAKKDILFVVAAGNSTTNNDTTASYPSNYNTTVGTSTESAAGYDSVISVAAINSSGGIAGFSSYGARTVDIGAPGVGIWSSVPAGTYASYDGTSMATPHVTGAIALYASTLPAGTSAASIKAAILDSATPTASLAGKTVTGGRLNVYEALKRSAYLELDNEYYTLPSTVTLTVNHAAANLNSAVADAVTVTIKSTTDSSPETVILTETGANTGRFAGSVALVSGANRSSDGILQAADGDAITAYYAALNRTAAATVDAAGPVISGAAVTPKTTTSEISWTTDEAATTEVIFGTSPSGLNQSFSNSSLVANHVATLAGLLPGTVYYYAMTSRDPAGNATTSATGSFTTLATPPILFVDDDQGAAFERFYTSALHANSYSYDTWDVVGAGRTPIASELQAYKVVVWNTGYNYSNATAGLSSAEQTAIAGYLDAGGRIFLSGQDILYNGVTTAFRQNYLKVAGFSSDVTSASHMETGVAGNAISNGMSLSVARPADFTSLYVDALSPATGAEGTFRHGVTSAAYPFSAVNYRGDFGAGGFGVVFSTLPFEAISTSAADPNNQKIVMRRTVEYLMGAEAAGFALSAPSPSSATTEAGGSVTFTVSLNTQPMADVLIPVDSSDAMEGTASPASLVFTSENWNTAQTVTVTGVDDLIDDGDVAYSVLLGAAVSDDAFYSGLDAADVGLTNLDNDAPATRFYVVNDGSPDRTYEYDSVGAAVENYSISTANTAPRGIATTAAGDRLWVVDKNRNVYVYSNSGSLLGSWTAGTLTSSATVEGIATDGLSIWIVDSRSDKVFYYAGAASRLSGTAAATSYYLNAANANSKDIVFGSDASGSFLWVVNDSATDKVFKYSFSATTGMSLKNSWTINTANKTPTGIAIDPANRSPDIWIVDSGTDRVYRYANGRTDTAPVMADYFALLTANSNPQGIADPLPYWRAAESHELARQSVFENLGSRQLDYSRSFAMPGPSSHLVQLARFASNSPAGSSHKSDGTGQFTNDAPRRVETMAASTGRRIAGVRHVACGNTLDAVFAVWSHDAEGDAGLGSL